MTLPSGVFSGVGLTSEAEFQVKSGIRQHSFASMKSQADKGTAVAYTATEGEVDIADANTTILAGVLAQDVYDPANLPKRVKENVFGDGTWFSKVGTPASVWKNGIFFVTNVSGVVAAGDVVVPAADGKWAKAANNVNTLQNGFIVCEVGNGGNAGDPIVISANLA